MITRMIKYFKALEIYTKTAFLLLKVKYITMGKKSTSSFWFLLSLETLKVLSECHLLLNLELNCLHLANQVNSGGCRFPNTTPDSRAPGVCQLSYYNRVKQTL